MAKEMTYDQANEELNKIVSEIEEGNVSVDLLSLKVKRASELIQFCKKKLFQTEEDIQKILDNLKEN